MAEIYRFPKEPPTKNGGEGEPPLPPPDKQGFREGDKVVMKRSNGEEEEGWVIKEFSVEFSVEKQRYTTWVTCISPDGKNFKQIEAKYLRGLTDTHYDIKHLREKQAALSRGKEKKEEPSAPKKKEFSSVEEQNLYRYVAGLFSGVKTLEDATSAIRQIASHLSRINTLPVGQKLRMARQRVGETIVVEMEGKRYQFGLYRTGSDYDLSPEGPNMLEAYNLFPSQ